jgi:hypothetical protein
MKDKNFKIFIYFLLLASIAGVCIIYLATYRFGPGLSTDATLNLSAAVNLMHGKGFVDLYGTSVIQWPPLYAFLLATLSRVTGVDVFQIGWHLNAIAFGLIVFFSGLLFYKTYPERPLYAYLGSIIVLTSLGIIQISANIASDPLFLLFVVMFLVSAKNFIDTKKSVYLWLMAILACLASFQRYAGLALALTGSLFVLYYYRNRLVKAFFQSVAFFVLSGIPIFGWGIFHNYPLSGKLFGSNQVTSPLGDLYIFIEKFLYWFFPYSIIRIATPIGLLAAIVLILVLINRQPIHWKNWFNRLVSDSQMANLIFTIIYGGMLVFYVSYYEHENLGSQRIHVVILPSLLIIIFAAIEELIPPRHDSPNTKLKYQIMTVFFILWLIYPFSKLQDYLQRSSGVEVSGTNVYNTAIIRESDFLTLVQTLSNTSQNVYSNYEAPAWFYTRRDIMSLPRVDKKGELDKIALAKFQQSIGPGGGGYIIWFHTINYREDLPKTTQLYQMTKIEPVFISNVGDIYHIVSNSP